MKTINELNTKSWYRFTKVLYFITLLFFLVMLPVGIFLGYQPKYDYSKSFVLCEDGRKYSFQQINLELNGARELDNLSQKKARFYCSDEISGLSESEIISRVFSMSSYDSKGTSVSADDFFKKDDIDNIVDSFFNHKIILVKNFGPMIGYSLLSILGILIVFEFLRRVFYYVMSGSINPKKE